MSDQLDRHLEDWAEQARSVGDPPPLDSQYRERAPTPWRRSSPAVVAGGLLLALGVGITLATVATDDAPSGVSTVNVQSPAPQLGPDPATSVGNQSPQEKTTPSQIQYAVQEAKADFEAQLSGSPRWVVSDAARVGKVLQLPELSSSNQKVYVVLLEGHFTCARCQAPPKGELPEGSDLLLVISADAIVTESQPIFSSLSDRPTALSVFVD